MTPGQIAEIEHDVRTAVPALEELAVAGWLLRISGGSTKRVNSANPLVPGARLEPVLAEAERVYGLRNLPIRFRLTPMAASDADAVLADAGYHAVDPSWTMISSLTLHERDPAVKIAAHPTSDWLAGFASASAWSAGQLAAHAALLGGVGEAAFAILQEGDRPAAFAAVSIGGSRACLFDVVVVPGARGRGLGRRIASALLGWAHERECEQAVLQVLADNRPARRLYASLGFADAYPYHYRVRQ